MKKYLWMLSAAVVIGALRVKKINLHKFIEIKCVLHTKDLGSYKY